MDYITRFVATSSKRLSENTKCELLKSRDKRRKKLHTFSCTKIDDYRTPLRNSCCSSADAKRDCNRAKPCPQNTSKVRHMLIQIANIHSIGSPSTGQHSTTLVHAMVKTCLPHSSMSSEGNAEMSETQ